MISVPIGFVNRDCIFLILWKGGIGAYIDVASCWILQNGWILQSTLVSISGSPCTVQCSNVISYSVHTSEVTGEATRVHNRWVPEVAATCWALPPPPEQWDCQWAAGRWRGLPWAAPAHHSLHSTPALQLTHRMQQLAVKPQKEWWEGGGSHLGRGVTVNSVECLP